MPVYLCIVVATSPLTAQTGVTGMPELEAALAATGASIRTQCPLPLSDARDELLRAESQRTHEVRGEGTPDHWFALGCARARLYAIDARSREGLLMPPGMSWHEGAALALLRGLDADPSHAPSAALLAELGMAEVIGPPRDRIAAALIRASERGVRHPLALRGCSELARRERLRNDAVRCATNALENGVDSVWQLLQLSRLAFMASDTANGQRLFHRATTSAHDSTDWAALGWH